MSAWGNVGLGITFLGLMLLHSRWLMRGVCASAAFALFMAAAAQWQFTNPPTIPCRQGMTLLPGQSCYMTMDILIPAGPRREETSY